MVQQSSVEKRLAELGLALPDANPPRGNYLPFQRCGNIIYVAGQGPRIRGQVVYKGLVGEDLTLEEGRQAARICALNILSQLRTACEGDLQRISRMIRLAGFVRCSADFGEQAKVLNAASDLICDILGEVGPHVRIATGTHALPDGMAVEIEASAEIR